MKLDMLAFETQFVDHLAAVWAGLPEAVRGDFIVPTKYRDHARMRGVSAVNDYADPERPVLVASYGDLKKARRVGRRRIAFIEHGAGQAYAGDTRSAGHGSYAGGRDRDDVGLFLVPNEYSAGLWRQAYPRARVEVVGSPKTEQLPAREPGRAPVVAVSFHFDCGIAPEARSAWSEFHRALPALAAAYPVIGHAHPRAFVTMGLTRYYARMSIPVVEDFADVCRQADLYVCDNSSTLFEFAATGRPVVVLNPSIYRRDVHHGGRFWDWATVGLNCDDPARLVETVGRALEDPPEVAAERERVLDLVYARRTGATQAAVAALLDWLALDAEAAA